MRSCYSKDSDCRQSGKSKFRKQHISDLWRHSQEQMFLFFWCNIVHHLMNFGSVEDALGQGAMSLTTLFRKATNLLGLGGDDSRTRPPPLDGEIIYCKNNVCVHPPANLNRTTTDHFPGYLNIRSQDDEVGNLEWRHHYIGSPFPRNRTKPDETEQLLSSNVLQKCIK